MPSEISLFTDDPQLATAVPEALRASGKVTVSSGEGRDLWSTLQRHSSDLVVADRRLFRGDAAEVISRLRAIPDRSEVAVLIAQDEVVLRAKLLAAGAMAVLSRETPTKELAAALEILAIRANEPRRLRALQRASAGTVSIQDIRTTCPRMKDLLELALQVAPSESSLLLQGETGTGKEHLARAIHHSSTRSSGPFVPLHCAALSESLLESELFGHVEGAFTGASRSRRGYFELADGGTIFLDEIGELSQASQVKLLRVLQEHSVQPIGSEESIPLSIRLIAASNRNLVQEVKEERFRADLYYRLSVVSLELPPLRERREDIPDMARQLLRLNREAQQRQILDLSPEALDALMAYEWPGNIRELANVLERAVLLTTTHEISTTSLPFTSGHTSIVQAGRHPSSITQTPLVVAREQVVFSFEAAYLKQLLTEARGRVALAARRAQINPRSLYEKMRRHGLRKEDFQDRDRESGALTS